MSDNKGTWTALTQTQPTEGDTVEWARKLKDGTMSELDPAMYNKTNAAGWSQADLYWQPLAK